MGAVHRIPQNSKEASKHLRIQRIHKNSKGFCEKLLSVNDLEAILATFCCYGYGYDASEAVQKIATDHEEYHQCSSCVIVCWITNIYQSITVPKKIGYNY